MYSNILSATNKLFSYFLFVDGFCLFVVFTNVLVSWDKKNVDCYQWTCFY